jgi:hypothetical protein
MACFWVSATRGDIYISELLADNESGIADEDGDRKDWLELYNSGDTAVSLDGWWLTDKKDDPAQWRIPAVSISAKGTLLVWASGKNRSNPAAPLHASFSLSKDGEYLGLYRPDPTNGLPVLVDEYAPKFPSLPPDVSFGRMFTQTATVFVASGEVGRYRVLTSGEGQNVYTNTSYAAGDLGHGKPGGWNVSPSFDDSAWTMGATGIGYDTTGGFDPWIGTSPSGNCLAALRTVNSSLCFRRTFTVPDPSLLVSLKLRMKYEDGFVAFINGVEVARANCNAAELAYNTAATVALNEAIVNSWTEYLFANQLLVAGTNLLAIQGLNVNVTSSDFLMLPEVEGFSSGTIGNWVYFTPSTPGAQNGPGTAGPLLCDATPEDPDVPRPLGNAESPPLTISVRVTRTKNSVSAVRAYPRTLYNAESAAVPLFDNGVAPDAVSGDGIYSASLPTTNVLAGQMFRWRFEAQDVLGVVTKLPAYADPLDSPQYFGTVAVTPSTVTSQLPVLEWFVQGAPANGPSAAAFRGSCYYLSNFYDNVGHEMHGQTSSGFAKHSYDFDFTGEKRFLWRDGERRVKDINLLSNFADKTKTRNSLSHWVGQQVGTPYHFAFSVRVQLNAGFHGVMDLVEDGDDRMLERNGLNPEGALYKIYNTDNVTMSEKKTRKEESFDDLRALTNGLSQASLRQTYACDNLDLAATVNYIAARYINSDHDHGHKNFYLYRDTGVTDEWQPLVWDVDLSWGHVYNATGTNNVYGKTLGYFDDAMMSTVGFSGGGNAVYKIIYEVPENRLMLMRRIRTLMDLWLQQPGTVNGPFETKMREIAAAVDPDPADPSPWTDGDLDLAKWGMNVYFATNRPREEVERVITGYIGPRRAYLFNTGVGRVSLNGSVIPPAQTHVPGMVAFDELDFLPSSGTQAHEYVILRNTTQQAVDISGWRVGGEISHVFKGGTVIPAGAGTAETNYIGLLHLVKDACAFRSRPSGPTGGQRRLVQGNYSGQLSARGGTVSLYDSTNQLIATMTYAGAPVPSQQWLRITEIQYHPAKPTVEEAAALIGVTADDFEYLEIMNTGTNALTLTGATFSQGIGYTFPTSTLAGGARLVLAKNLSAFAFRYPLANAPVVGPYEGMLDNNGERLELTDVCGENILDFEYKDGWYPASDGSGRSLVLRDTASAYDAFGQATVWALCSEEAGTPGEPETGFSQVYYGWDNFYFTEEQRAAPLVAGPYADPDSDGRMNWVEYALGSNPWVADAEAIDYVWVTRGDDRMMALRFNRPPHPLDVRYELLATSDLVYELWGVITDTTAEATLLAADKEAVTLRETNPVGAAKRFYRLCLTYESE